MYSGKDRDEEKAKISQSTAREIVDMIDSLICKRIQQYEEMSDAFNREEIEVIKRELTDYLLVTDPRQGVFISPKA